MITASLSPNTEYDDVFRALKTFCTPWTWRQGNALQVVRQWFRVQYNVETVSLFTSGRMAATAILESFNIGRGDEVLVQAFTCVAVPNSVLWAHATPVYVDIDESGNIDVTDAQQKLTKKTKAMIVQHTFGISSDIHALSIFCKKNNILLIEDCAHSLGLTVKHVKVGTFGDAAFFSFGRDKVLSSVWGGVAIIKKSHTNEAKKLTSFERSLPFPTIHWIGTQLLHPLLFSISMPVYSMGLGKAMIAVCKAMHLITLPIYPTEFTGGKPAQLETRYPNALATLILTQLKKLDRYKTMRNDTTDRYLKLFSLDRKVQTYPTPFGATYLRFPILTDDKTLLLKAAKKEGILLGNWYSQVIDPKGVSLSAVSYKEGSCPRAEYYAKHTVNIPTRLTKRQRDRVCTFLSSHV